MLALARDDLLKGRIALKRDKNLKVSEEEIGIQKDYIKQIRSLDPLSEKKYVVTTFGCQMSESDGERIAGMLDEMGYSQTDDINDADIVVFNTCCVRDHAEKRIYGKLGELKSIKENKQDMIIAFGGCMAQQPHVVEKLKKSYQNVDIIFGTHNVHRLPELFYYAMNGNKMVEEVWDIEGVIPEGMPVSRKDGLKAWVNIMFGCNNFCSYCIVPYVRGRERSREPKDIISEISLLVQQGYKEVSLLGQNVNSYGLDADFEMSFPQLLRELNKIEGLERIRFMTSHPKDMSDDLIKVIQECEKVCEHIHLPFQSGSNNILKKMNRKYTKEHYLGLIEKIKTAVPGASFTTDVIVGFPGETEEDFLDTLEVVKQVKFDLAYTFLYSRRKGTPAAEMEEQIDELTSKNRFDRLLDAVYKIIEENNQAMIGNTEEVLVESVSKNNDEYMTGRTRTNKIVNFKGDKSLIGKLVNVKIISQHMWYLNGEAV
jgi:tRNA-2-methylthio-N6-dimethylallyladenosine synthase